jgi:signal transduction histidine kinase
MRAELEVALRDPSVTKKDYQELIKSNLEEVNKLTKLSEMLLNLSRLDHDKLERSSLNLYSITKNVVRQFAIASSRIQISAKKDIYVTGNDVAIHELISILVDNALKYSPASSVVLITLTSNNRQAQFDITNRGPGIDATVLPHIFDRFYRGDSSRTKNIKNGFGLGLALAKNIVQLHNGELSATSAPENDTTFTVHLPLTQSRSSKN